jgi:phospholipase C
MTKPGTPDQEAIPTADSAGVPPRRQFLKASAAAAGATLLSSCISGSGIETTNDAIEDEDDAVSRFDKLVVLMFENRSLDNVLGYLYPAGGPFNGLNSGSYSNPVPPQIKDGHSSVPAQPSPGTSADFQNPNPDPGEGYPHISTQLFGLVSPETNRYETSAMMKTPFNTPPDGTPPDMKGFVNDYCNNYRASQGRDPTYEEYRVIMDAFTSEQLPVLSKLAKEFAVYDAWFCAVPSQTYCNRSFFNASSSSGFVLNAPHKKWIENNIAPTIFNRLHENEKKWMVYYDELQLVPLTALIHAPKLYEFWKTNFATMKQFYADVAAGTLPDYAFVEPRMLFNHNDFHPPGPLIVDGIKIPSPSDVRAGDLLLHQVYDAIRTSKPNGTGFSTASNTMLLVTFDEHGGCYDHVAPPGATPPDNPQISGEMDFLFDRLGLRVPSIAISAYTDPVVVKRPVHHAAVIRTLCRKHKLDHLTDRDRDAPDLSDAINRTSFRDPSTWPVTGPPQVSQGAFNLDPMSPELAPVRLNELELHIVALALTYFTGVEQTTDSVPKTVGAAYSQLKPLVTGVFGGS